MSRPAISYITFFHGLSSHKSFNEKRNEKKKKNKTPEEVRE